MRLGACANVGPLASLPLLLLCRVLEVLDKGKAAAVTTIVETKDTVTGKVIFENQSTVFVRGSGGFGGKRVGNGENGRIAVLFLSLTKTYLSCRPWCCYCDKYSPEAQA